MVFSGFSGASFPTFFLSFPLFLWSNIQRFWGQNKNSGEGLGFWFLVSGFAFWFSGVFILASRVGYNKRSFLSAGGFFFRLSSFISLVLSLLLFFFSKQAIFFGFCLYYFLYYYYYYYYFRGNKIV